jgi:hypothetical protein
MSYRILITKTLDIPKNIHQDMLETEEEAVKAAKERLVEYDGDVAVVMQLIAGSTKVIHRFEQVRSGT